MNAKQAIARSISHNEIVTIDHDAEAIETLTAECEDNVHSSYGATEFWGTTDDGNEWRVHVRDGGIADSQIETLKDEAGAAGDAAQVELCDAALSGDASARRECERVIADAAAQG